MERTLTRPDWALSMSEKEVCSALEDALELGGWLWSHHPDSRRLHGQPGMPDYVAVHTVTNRVLFIEAKTTAGRLTKRQQKWGERLAASKADYWVVRPTDLDVRVKELVAERTAHPVPFISNYDFLPAETE